VSLGIIIVYGICMVKNAVKNLDDNVVRSLLVEEGFEEERSNSIKEIVRNVVGSNFDLDLDEETPNSEA
jgi:hypothetical protein